MPRYNRRPKRSLNRRTMARKRRSVSAPRRSNRRMAAGYSKPGARRRGRIASRRRMSSLRNTRARRMNSSSRISARSVRRNSARRIGTSHGDIGGMLRDLKKGTKASKGPTVRGGQHLRFKRVSQKNRKGYQVLTNV